MLGSLMIIAGLLLTIGAVLTGYRLGSSACVPEDNVGCPTGFIERLSAMMIADEGIFFWLAWVAGIFLIWGGMRLRARAS